MSRLKDYDLGNLEDCFKAVNAGFRQDLVFRSLAECMGWKEELQRSDRIYKRECPLENLHFKKGNKTIWSSSQGAVQCVDNIEGTYCNNREHKNLYEALIHE
jgi:hypothetical protein